MEECAFYKLDLERNRIIRESEKSYVILSNPCLMKGHCLIIPKKHVEKLSQLNLEEREGLIKQIVKIEELLLKKIFWMRYQTKLLSISTTNQFKSKSFTFSFTASRIMRRTL